MGKRGHSAKFKAKVALEAIKGEETASQIASRYGIHPAQVRTWKREFLANASSVFENSRTREKQLEKKLDELYKQIGQLKVEGSGLL